MLQQKWGMLGLGKYFLHLMNVHTLKQRSLTSKDGFVVILLNALGHGRGRLLCVCHRTKLI